MSSPLTVSVGIIADCCTHLDRSVNLEDIKKHYYQFFKPILNLTYIEERKLFLRFSQQISRAKFGENTYFSIDEEKLPANFLWNTPKIDSLIKLEVFRLDDLKKFIQKTSEKERNASLIPS